MEESMREIYTIDDVKIRVNDQTSIFRIEFAHPSPSLIRSLIKTKLIQGATSTSDYKIIQFKATSVKSFAQFQSDLKTATGAPNLPIGIAAHMTGCLTQQLKYLVSTESRTILGYAAAHVIVINDKKFAYLGSEFVSEIEGVDPTNDNNPNLDNRTQICYPFSPTDFFVSPELLKITELPSHVHYKTAYFSMACLIIYALLNNADFYTEYLQHHQADKIITALHPHPINETKLYWLLSRCLLEDPERRTILLI
jgi:serine/threonine protein kinase